ISNKRKTVEATKSLFSNAGFKIENIKEDSFSMRFIDGTSFLNHYVIKFAFMPSWMEILKKEDLHFIFNEIENELNAKAEKEGELKLTIPFACINCRK
ncbi:MAG: hypothetical protein ABSG15_06055, partial [FCB group bacterium]